MVKKSKVRVGLVAGILSLLMALPVIRAGAAPAAKPEGTLTAALYTLGEEGYLPDRCTGSTGPIWEAVYDYLLYSDNGASGKSIPGLAERYEYSKDFRTLTFFIRKGVQFHDGWGDLTAEDVKWSIEFYARKTSTNLRAVDLRNKIKNMEMPDRHTLVINLKEPDPMFWMNFCTVDSVSLPVLCKKYIESVGEEKANVKPIGSGPYRFVEHKIGDYAKFEAVEKHWLLVPEFKYLILRVVAEDSTRVAMLKTGDVDIALELPIDKVPELEAAGIRSVITPVSNLIYFPFGGMLLPEDKRYVEGYHRKDPWVDIRVREAMSIAIDRQAIVKNIYRGSATAAPIFWTLPGWEKLQPIPFDPARAKKLLAEAGYANGFSFKIPANAKSPEMMLIAQAAAAYWQDIGLKPEINQYDYATWRTINKSGKTANCVWTHATSNYVDWESRLAEYELPGASTPLFQSEETKVAIKKVQVATDPQKRDAAFRELGQVYRSLWSHVSVVYPPRVHGANKKVGEWLPGRLLHPKNLIFAKQPKPLNTYRLFTP